MPTRREYWECGDANRAVGYDILTSDARGGWAATIFFYAAVHYVNAHATSAIAPKWYEPFPKPKPGSNQPSPHRKRLNHVAKNFPDLEHAAYVRLREMSEDARYRCKEYDVATAKSLGDSHLARIRGFVGRAIGST